MRTAGVAGLLALLFTSAPAGASPVLVLKHGRATTERERFAGPTDLPRPPASRSPARPRLSAAAARPPIGRATRQGLDNLVSQGAIDQPTHDAQIATLNNALRAYRRLSGTRRAQLGAVIRNADEMAVEHTLTASRLAAVFATIDANTQWWTTGPLLSSGARVSVGGSPLIFQYYPGQGIQLQMLANWGKANGYFQGHQTTKLQNLVEALVPLAANRGGWPAWEYYFHFAGGDPPWTSAISQGTAIQALARAGQRLQDTSLWDLGRKALTAFQTPPPLGVRKDTPTGPFYLIYSYAPNQLVINADLQALVGLFDFAKVTGDTTAQTLFQQGDADAQTVLPTYDTGHWSLYDQTTESDLNYHQLVTGFLENLCKRTSTPVYCDTAQRFNSYMKQPPSVKPTTGTIRGGRAARLSLTVDKISRVTVSVTRGGRTFFSASAVLGRGSHFFSWLRPARAGGYTFTARATDLAGNRSPAAKRALRILAGRK